VVVKIWHDAWQCTKPPQRADVANRGTWVKDEEKYDEWVKLMDEMEAIDTAAEEAKKEYSECCEKLKRVMHPSVPYDASKWQDYADTNVAKPTETASKEAPPMPKIEEETPMAPSKSE
jgi:seryl-tRNA synthetase